MGETPQEERLSQFETMPDIVITNPDFLHYQLNRGKQKDWYNWVIYLKYLRLVILDEVQIKYPKIPDDNLFIGSFLLWDLGMSRDQFIEKVV